MFISSDLGWSTLAGGKHTHYRSGSSCSARVPCVKLPTVHRLQLHLWQSLRQKTKTPTKPNTLQTSSQNTRKIITNLRCVHCRRQQHKPQKCRSENPVPHTQPSLTRGLKCLIPPALFSHSCVYSSSLCPHPQHLPLKHPDAFFAH